MVVQQDDSAGKDACCQASRAEFNPPDLHGGKRTNSCKLALWLVIEFNLHLGVVKDHVRSKVICSLHSKKNSWQRATSEEVVKASLLH